MQINWRQVAFQVVFTLVLLEVVLRLLGFFTSYSENNGGKQFTYYGHREPTWYPSWTPNATIPINTDEFQYTIHTNSLGIREREIPAQKPDSVKRIFILGDSFTEGDGVDISNAMPARLQKILDSLHIKAEIFNCGISGSDPFSEYVLLRDKLLPLHPDMIIQCTNITDFDDYTGKGGMERFQPDGTVLYRKAPAILPVYQASYVFRMVVFLLFQMNDTLLTWWQQSALDQQALLDIRQCLYQTRNLCRQNNMTLLCVMQPIPETYRNNPPTDQVTTLADSIPPDSLQVINLYPDFEPHLSNDRFYQYMWDKNYHFNIPGYQLYANLLFNRMQQDYPQFLQ